ncbi:MAG: hypothetical protein Q3972_06340 [Corynebacterium sp.]|nr:hypothetical protein [Corynebacterium sp.]
MLKKKFAAVLCAAGVLTAGISAPSAHAISVTATDSATCSLTLSADELATYIKARNAYAAEIKKFAATAGGANKVASDEELSTGLDTGAGLDSSSGTARLVVAGIGTVADALAQIGEISGGIATSGAAASNPYGVDFSKFTGAGFTALITALSYSGIKAESEDAVFGYINLINDPLTNAYIAYSNAGYNFVNIAGARACAEAPEFASSKADILRYANVVEKNSKAAESQQASASNTKKASGSSFLGSSLSS